MNEPVQRLPWPITLAALLAMSTHATSAGAGPLVLGLGFALLLHRFIGVRLPRSAWPAWVVRLVLFSAITWLRRKYGDRADGRLYGAPLDLAGELCAAELALEAWRSRPTAAERDAATMFLSVIVLVAGCNVYQDMLWPHVVVPLYFVFLIPSLRGLRGRGGWTRRHGVGYIAGAWLALVAGGATGYEVWDHRAELTAIDSRFLSFFLDPHVGFTDQTSLGRGPGGRGGLDRALRVEGELTEPYLRGASFDRYARGVWLPSAKRWTVIVGKEWLGQGSAGPQATITRLEGPTTTAFLPLHCAGLNVDHPSLRDAAGSRVIIEGEPPVSWSVAQGRDRFHQGPLCVPPSDEDRLRCLDVPAEISRSVRTLANRIGASLSSPEEKIHAVEGYLQTNHRYSLSYEPCQGDRVSEFLDRKGAAHCEYFASAAVILLRCLGVPARYVSGYYCHEEAGGNVKVVRSRDAHAWAEAWVEGTGWVTVEATPASGMPGEAEDGPSWLRRAWERGRDALGDAVHWIMGLDARGVLWLTTSLLVLVTTIFALWRWWRRRRPRRRIGAGQFTTPAGFERITARFERLLARRGISCPAGRTWREVVRAGAEREFVERYNSARFGGPDGMTLKTLEEELKSLEGRA